MCRRSPTHGLFETWPVQRLHLLSGSAAMRTGPKWYLAITRDLTRPWPNQAVSLQIILSAIEMSIHMNMAWQLEKQCGHSSGGLRLHMRQLHRGHNRVPDFWRCTIYCQRDMQTVITWRLLSVKWNIIGNCISSGCRVLSFMDCCRLHLSILLLLTRIATVVYLAGAHRILTRRPLLV